MSYAHLLFFLCVSTFASAAHAQLIARTGTGASPAALTATRDQFRSDIGGGTVAGANGSFGGLRREVNWDGVPAAFAAPNNMPVNFFNVNSPRGIVIATAGIGLQVSAGVSDPSGQPVNFGNLNASYVSTFIVFSSQRLFTSLGSNIFDVIFYVPGTSIPATVTGFGAVFTDVDQANTTRIQFFDRNDVSLGSVNVPSSASGLSFAGASSGDGRSTIARVRVTLGNAVIGPNDNNGTVDVVVADDFIYGEPTDRIFADNFE
jgi:hypothetical protein